MTFRDDDGIGSYDRDTHHTAGIVQRLMKRLVSLQNLLQMNYLKAFLLKIVSPLSTLKWLSSGIE